MSNIFIIHGAYGNPSENWFPWLKEELEKDKKDKVIIPTFPTPKNQSLESWLKVFRKYENDLKEDSIVIGHSIGATFLLHILENHETPIKSAFLISGFMGKLNNPEFDTINKTFTDVILDWKLIQRHAKKFYIYHSDNDPYVPLKKAEDLAKNLNTKLITIKGAGHFNTEAGYNKFEQLLEKVKEEL